MALPLPQPSSTTQSADLLSKIEAEGTPLRIDGQTETYYVLSASQLNALISRFPDDSTNFEDATNFTPEDFGLTEADLAKYEMTQQIRQKHIATQSLQPLSDELSNRLTQHTQQSASLRNNAEKKKLLHQLEAAMLANLQASISASNDS